MTPDEINSLQKYLNNATDYLEYGSGNSTLLALSSDNINSITSVESSSAYIAENLLIKEVVSSAIKKGLLNFIIVDIGKTKKWGRPIDSSKAHLWPNYSLIPFLQKKDYDFVLIDGRFRVSCILNCILELPSTATL